MSFNKRYVSMWKLREWFKEGGIVGVLRRLGQADALICEDDFSTNLVSIFRSDKLPADILVEMGKLLDDKFGDS